VRELRAIEVGEISISAWTFILCFLVATALVIAANVWIYSMLEEVNRRLPKTAQIEMSGLRWKMYEVLRLHAEMYPESPKRWQMWTMALSGFALMFGGFFASWILPR
jgi:hypothetical protein